jgi:hypothetical protein
LDRITAHYFDRIIVEDSVAHELTVHWKEANHAEREKWILSHIDVLLYLREVGAEELVEFAPPNRSLGGAS